MFTASLSLVFIANTVSAMSCITSNDGYSRLRDYPVLQLNSELDQSFRNQQGQQILPQLKETN